MKKIIVNIIPQLKDNFSYILQSIHSSKATIIDPADSEQHLRFLKEKNLILQSIILTHHHNDHTGGVKKLVHRFPYAFVFSPNISIEETTKIIQNKGKIKTAINEFDIISTPGHTLDHVVLYDKTNGLLFSGDTLFRLGCGRIFEGTFKQMYHSLQKLNKLPDKTIVYCGAL